MVPTAELPRGQKVRKSSKQSSCKFSFQAQMPPSPSSEELADSCLLPMSISWPFLYVMFPSVSDCPESSLQSFSRTSFSPLGSSLVWAKRGSRKPPPEGTSSGIWSHIWQNLGKCLLPTIEFPCLRKKKKRNILWCSVPSFLLRQEENWTVCLKEGQYVRNEKTAWSYVVSKLNQTKHSCDTLYFHTYMYRQVYRKVYRQVYRKRNNKMLTEIISRWEENLSF